jgi:hypothetical protein
MTESAAPRGWAFLVARGRTEGYRFLLAPDFLLAKGAHAVIEARVSTLRRTDGEPEISVLPTPVGRLCLVAETHVATEADLNGVPEGTSFLRDEHGRPLHLTYGFVSDRLITGPVAREDLDNALTIVLATFRDFLSAEHSFTTRPAGPFTLRSATAALPADPVGNDNRRSRIGLVAATALVALVIVAVGVMVLSGGPAPTVATPIAKTLHPTAAPVLPPAMLGSWVGWTATTVSNGVPSDPVMVELRLGCDKPCSPGASIGTVDLTGVDPTNPNSCHYPIIFREIWSNAVDFAMTKPTPATCPSVTSSWVGSVSMARKGRHAVLQVSLPTVSAQPILMRLSQGDPAGS